jgi:hypothetical protein
LVADNKLFAVVLIPAFLLRVDAELGYRWWVYFNDSFDYISTAATGVMDPARVSGYAIYLGLLRPFHSFALVTVSQHVMGLLVGVMIYALARHRFGAPSWLAVLMTLPVLYDGFEINLEHQILSDTMFLFLAMLAITVLLWSPLSAPRSWWRCALAGLLVGASAIVRSTGLPLIPVFAVYIIIGMFPRLRRSSGATAGAGAGGAAGGGGQVGWRGWRTLVAGVAAFGVVTAVPVLGYEALYDQQHHEFAMNTSTGVFLYSRVMTFADCSKMQLTPELLALCSTVPPDKRPIAQAYIWTPASPLDRFPPPKFSPLPDALAQQFAIKAIEAQPLDYARTVFDDTWMSFGWSRSVFPNAATYDEYLFGYHPLEIPSSPTGRYPSSAAYYVQGDPRTRISEPFAGAMRVYQRYFWLPGTVYGLILLAGLIMLVARWRRGGQHAFLPWLSSVALIVVPAASAQFDYRYVTTAVPFACLALALAIGRPPRQRGGEADSTDASGAVESGDEDASAVTAGSVGGVRPSGAVGPAGSPGSEASGAAGLPGSVAGGRLDGGTANASYHESDLTPDAT